MEKMEDLRRRLVGDIEGENRYTIGKDIYKDNLSYYEGEPTTYPKSVTFKSRSLSSFDKAKLSDAKYLDEIMGKYSKENRDSLHSFPTKALRSLLNQRLHNQRKETKEKLFAYGYGMNVHKYFEHFKRAVQDRLQKEIEEQLKTKKMKTKKFYHTFDFKGREITLLLHVQEDYKLPYFRVIDTAIISLTYSVRLHEDEEIEGLTKKIALGRLTKRKLLDVFSVEMRFGFKLAYLKGLAYCFENEIKNGSLEIVGVINGIAKDKKAALEQSSQEVNANLEQ